MSNKYYLLFPHDEIVKGWYEFYAEYVTDIWEYAREREWVNCVCKSESVMTPPKEQYPAGCLETFCIVKRSDKTYVMRQYGNDKAIVTFERSSEDKSRNVFWHLRLEGLHDGEPINIAVKNVRSEADEYGFSVTHDGIGWSDDFEAEFPDDILDWYDNPLGDALKELYAESYAGDDGYYF